MLLLLILPAPANAQLEPLLDESLNIAVRCEKTFLFPAYAGQDSGQCDVLDLSRDSLVVPGTQGGTSVSPHQLRLSAEFLDNDTLAKQGWQFEIAPAVASIFGGQVLPVTVTIKATPLVARQDVRFNLHVDYTGPNNHQRRVTVPFVAEVSQYDFAIVSIEQSTLSQRAGQDEVVRYQVNVQNVGVYPDSYRFTVNSEPDIHVTAPASLYVPPGETRSVFVDVLTPHGKIFEVGRSTAVNVKVNSVSGSGVYSAVGVLQIRGAYFPIYWIPLLLVGLVSAGVVIRGSREKSEMRKLEKGRPRRVALTPKQAVLLAEMKRVDADAYKEKKGTLDTVYKERVGDYRAHRKERLAADREEARQANAEFAAKKKARKAERKEQKRAEKIARTLEKREEKARRSEARREAKILKKKEKVLLKKRAKLEKQKAKADKRQAKIDAKDAKAAAKQAKLDVKAAKRAEKEAKKQQK